MGKKSDWLMSDYLWSRIEPLLPVPEDKHPLGCHHKRVSNRSAMDAILFVLRTGCQWNALNATGICRVVLRTVGFWNGLRLEYLSISGGKACSSMRRPKELTGHGFRWMGRCARRR